MKLMVDGVLSTHNPALSAWSRNIGDRPDTRGGSPSRAWRRFTALGGGRPRGRGFPVATHAIGEYGGGAHGCWTGLNGRSRPPRSPFPTGWRHMELVHPDDLPRSAGQGVGGFHAAPPNR